MIHFGNKSVNEIMLVDDLDHTQSAKYSIINIK